MSNKALNRPSPRWAQVLGFLISGEHLRHIQRLRELSLRLDFNEEMKL